MERANGKLKDFRISSFVPSYLHWFADILFQLCAALVILQFSLVKKGCKYKVFDSFCCYNKCILKFWIEVCALWAIYREQY